MTDPSLLNSHSDAGGCLSSGNDQQATDGASNKPARTTFQSDRVRTNLLQMIIRNEANRNPIKVS